MGSGPLWDGGMEGEISRLIDRSVVLGFHFRIAFVPFTLPGAEGEIERAGLRIGEGGTHHPIADNMFSKSTFRVEGQRF